LRLIHRKKFEAEIVDSHVLEGRECFLDQVRASASNRNAVTFAISERTLMPKEQASYFLDTPLSRSSIDKTLMTSFGMIVRERRRTFRCPTLSPAMLSLDDLGAFRSEVLDISEGGISLSIPRKLQAGDCVAVQFEFRLFVETRD
jgi:hypothetical protein